MLRCESDAPCEAGWPLQPNFFMPCRQVSGASSSSRRGGWGGTHSGEALALGGAADVDHLADAEPGRGDGGADGGEAQGVGPADLELGEPALGGDAGGGEVAEQGPRHVAGLLGAGADLDGVVAVHGARLVRDHLVAVELQHRARVAPPRARVVHARHAALDRQRPRPHRRAAQLARQRRRRRRPQRRPVRVVREARQPRRVFRLEGAHARPWAGGGQGRRSAGAEAGQWDAGKQKARWQSAAPRQRRSWGHCGIVVVEQSSSSFAEVDEVRAR